MKEIPLTKGYVAQVDDDMFDYLSQWKWRALRTRYTVYAVRAEYIGNYKTREIRMHRAITDCPAGMFVDHIDHNGLNNQGHNLRVCTLAENSRNIQVKPHLGSRYKGVCRHIDRWDGG